MPVIVHGSPTHVLIVHIVLVLRPLSVDYHGHRSLRGTSSSLTSSCHLPPHSEVFRSIESATPAPRRLGPVGSPAARASVALSLASLDAPTSLPAIAALSPLP